MLLEIVVDELEDEVELILAGYHVLEANDVGVLQFLQERDFADCSRGNALVIVLQTDLLESDGLIGNFIAGLVNDTVGALSDFGDSLVALNLLVGVVHL